MSVNTSVTFVANDIDVELGGTELNRPGKDGRYIVRLAGHGAIVAYLTADEIERFGTDLCEFARSLRPPAVTT